MKKIKGVIILAMLTILIFSLVGCGDKTPVSTSDFKTKAEESGYSILDVSNQFEGVTGFSACYLAVDSTKSYQLEFFVLENDENAITSYNKNKSNFKAQKGSSSVESELKIGNTSKYTLHSNDKFMMVSRIGNTFLYCSVPSEYESNIDDFIDKINY